ncbi:MAG: hypothetical protein K0B81_06460 [Candidatus Cloacimonetes bacterium]|nr:hypothetical protein [Candidatus Cloacimonadota bacterium]
MYYRNELLRILKDEKNIVNRMYMNEISLQLRKLEKALAKSPEEKDFFSEVAYAMNNFSQQLDNPKYQYNRSTKNGFRKNSAILSSSYIDDYIESIFVNQKILRNKGVVWGKQSFSMNVQFDPYNLSMMEKDLRFDFKESPQFLQLTQKIDFQFRIFGKKTFEKYEVVLPLIVFHSFKNLYETDLINIEHYADKAKKSLGKSRTIIICESIDPNILPDVKCPYIDTVFILRKQKISSKQKDISADVLQAIYEKIDEYLYKGEKEIEQFERIGYIT